MSATRDWLVRSVTRSTLRLATVDSVSERRSPEAKPGELEVGIASGGTIQLPIDAMFALHSIAATSEEAEDVHGILQAAWPETAGKRKLHRFSDGLGLCDMTAALRSDVYAIALMEYGVLNGWWKLVYDENLTCSHSDTSCTNYCTIYIDGYKRSTGRKRKEKAKVPALSKFRLPDLFPERGIAIA